jgi:hypothetical protein
MCTEVAVAATREARRELFVAKLLGDPLSPASWATAWRHTTADRGEEVSPCWAASLSQATHAKSSVVKLYEDAE